MVTGLKGVESPFLFGLEQHRFAIFSRHAKVGIAGGLVGSWAWRLFGLARAYYSVTAFLGALLISWLARVLGRRGG